jgi:prepilin-type N-terminal cleavage/methylation domain-containing protein
MKKQSGFTLIELLLVLAIIGIISAIALPALLGQRARARDKTAVQGSIGRIGDLVGQYDKAKEAIQNGVASTVPDLMNAYLSNEAVSSKDTNPWDTTGTGLIFSTALGSGVTGSSKSVFDAGLVSIGSGQTVGQGVGYMQLPTSNSPGFVGVAVKLHDTTGGTNIVQIKSVAVE